MKRGRGGEERIEFAAGGLVWSGRPGRGRLAVIRRRRYRDWTLPKGKRKRGEELGETALREVTEELSGCVEPALGEFAGVTWYRKKRRPKVVFFWHMTTDEAPGRFEPNEEVTAVAWLTVRQAVARLGHESERALVAAAGRALAGR